MKASITVAAVILFSALSCATAAQQTAQFPAPQLTAQWEAAKKTGDRRATETARAALEALKKPLEAQRDRIYEQEDERRKFPLWRDYIAKLSQVYGPKAEETLSAKLGFARDLTDADQDTEALRILNQVWADGPVTSDARAEAGTEAANIYELNRDFKNLEIYALRSAKASEVHESNGSLNSSYQFLGEALIEQKAYGRAVDMLRNWGGAEYGVALEALGRDREAEAVWRKLNDATRLSANLERQGRLAEAASVADQSLQYRRLSPAVDIDAYLATNPLEDFSVSAEYRRQAQNAESRGDTANASLYRSLAASIEVFQRTMLTPQNYRERLVASLSLAPEDARIGGLRFAAGDFAGAETSLQSACPQLRRKSVTDYFMTTDEDLSDPHVPVDVCFGQLALADHQLRGKDGFDPSGFEAAQLAVDNQAAAAMSQSAARRLAVALGAGPILEDIEKETAILTALRQPVVERFSGVDVNAMGVAQFEKAMRENAGVLTEMEGHNVRLQALEKQLLEKAPNYVALRSPDPVSLAALQDPKGRLLKDDEAVVLWFAPTGSQKGLVFAVSKTASGWAEIPLTGDQIAQRVTLLRRQIDPCAYEKTATACRVAPSTFDRSAAYELHQALLGQPQIQAVISPTAIKTLLIVPSGAMTALPPAVLVTQRPQGGAERDRSPETLQSTPWLITKKAIAVLPTVSALRTLRVTLPDARPAGQAPNSNGPLLMLADPAFGGPGAKVNPACAQRSAVRSISTYFNAKSGIAAERGALCRLPGTAREAQALEGLLGGLVLTDADAREGRLYRGDGPALLLRAQILAFATHGLVSGELGLGEPALALAAPTANEPQDDGFLTASEISTLKTDADFVLLSACNTGGGDTPEAYGLSGLSRAFLQAGAHSLLVSHWRVDDGAAEKIVTETVRLSEREGMSKAAALQSASLSFMNGGPEPGTFAHPAFWAPFTLIGEP